MTQRDWSKLGPRGQLVYGKGGEGDRYDDVRGVEYERPLEFDPRWVVTVVLEVVGGRLVVTELKLRASGEGFLGSGPPVVPEGGITSPLLRQVPVARLVEEARAKAQAAEPRYRPTKKKKRGKVDPVEQALDAVGRELGAVAESGRQKRPRRRDDEHYLAWAVAYSRKLVEGSHAPVAEIARDLGVDRGIVRDRLHVARARGLLTDVPEGARVGGELTDKARELLAKMKEA